MPYQDQYTQLENQRALITGPTYDSLIQTKRKHPDVEEFIVTVKQLGMVGEPLVTIRESKWRAVQRPNRSIVFVEVQE